MTVRGGGGGGGGGGTREREGLGGEAEVRVGISVCNFFFLSSSTAAPSNVTAVFASPASPNTIQGTPQHVYRFTEGDKIDLRRCFINTSPLRQNTTGKAGLNHETTS
ncbi:hypothetical protein E2C01_084507 [Portunus trituberculatus]|uniref:Uncharacterized protein n=1 Tax=Portunus trituberculatus TaxID=210409 RepID=A0A5B7JAY0_PORTR|nr:hypothetical protein [Portunus trituberculatus]